MKAIVFGANGLAQAVHRLLAMADTTPKAFALAAKAATEAP